MLVPNDEEMRLLEEWSLYQPDWAEHKIDGTET